MQIQISLLKQYSSFSIGTIELLSSDLSKALLKNDKNKLASIIDSINDVYRRIKDFKGKKLCNAYTFLDVLLFNISLGLQKARLTFQNMLVQSTGTEQFDQKKIIQRAEEMNRDIQKVLFNILSTKELSELLLISKEQKGTKILELSCLWQTIQFIMKKYKIKIQQIHNTSLQIQHLMSEIPPLKIQQFRKINNYLFNDSSKNLIFFLNNLNTNKQFHICNILSRNDSKSPLFSSIIPTHHVISNIMTYILKSNQKESYLLFSTQHYNSSPHCVFLLNFMTYNFSDILFNFHSVFLKLTAHTNQLEYYSINSNQIKQINNLLESYLSSNFAIFLNTIFKVINTKYSRQQSIEILKLLVFNRFLLNAELHHLILPINHDFSLHANKIKNIFFPSKLKNIESIISISMKSFKIFTEMCQSQEKIKKSQVFLTDKILYLSYQELQTQMNLSPTPIPNKLSSPLLNNSNSLCKNILNQISSSSLKESEHDDQMMMNWLIQYKRQRNHRNNQRKRYQQHCDILDSNTNRLFSQLNQTFKVWKQKILQTKAKYKINAKPIF